MNTTGAICAQSGVYESECAHREQITLTKGDPFPACSQGHDFVIWNLIRAAEPAR